MTRALSAILFMLALGVSAANSDELKGTVKNVDSTKKRITLTVDGKDQTLPVSKDASFVSVGASMTKKGKPTEKVSVIENGLAGVSTGAKVTVLTESEGGKDVILSVKVSSGDQPVVKKAKNAKKKKNQNKKKKNPNNNNN
jgi:Cu/Ag efflux protein CusF